MQAKGMVVVILSANHKVLLARLQISIAMAMEICYTLLVGQESPEIRATCSGTVWDYHDIQPVSEITISEGFL